MALNKKLRRVFAGVQETMHPETVKAKVFQDFTGTARSDFSVNLFSLTPDLVGKYLKIDTLGNITKVNTPADFEVANAVHPHPMTEITYVHPAKWASTVSGSHDTAVDSPAIMDQATFLEYLNSVYPLNSTSYNTYPSGHVMRGTNSTSQPGVYYYAIAYWTTETLDSFMNDLNNGKVPLSGGKIPKEYFPAYTAGHMTYTGGADLSAGTSAGAAVDISTIFTALATNPDEQLGDFKIVTASGYLKADGVTSTGTGFIHSNVEGPVFLNVGDRIVFVHYNSVGPVYDFAFMQHDYIKADAHKKGVVGLSDAASTTRGQLSTGTDGLNAVDELTLRNAMRDVVYYNGMPTVQLPVPYTPNQFYVYYTPQSGEPTHTSGDATSAFAPFSTVGMFVILSNGKSYTLKTYSPPSNVWTYVGTVAVPSANRGTYVNHYAMDDAYLVISKTASQGIFEKTNFVEGDLVIV